MRLARHIPAIIGKVKRFFAAWRAFAERLTRALLVVFGTLSVLTAIQLEQQGRSRWLVVGFVIFGVAIVIASLPRRNRT